MDHFLKMFFWAICFTIVAPLCAMADMNYIFMKAECHPDSKIFSAHVFFEANKPGKALHDRHENNVYDLEEMSGKYITCDLGDNQTITIKPYINNNTNTSNLTIGSTNLDNFGIHGTYYLDYAGNIDFNLEPIGNGKFRFKYCTGLSINLPDEIKNNFAAQFEAHKRVCEITEGKDTKYVPENKFTGH